MTIREIGDGIEAEDRELERAAEEAVVKAREARDASAFWKKEDEKYSAVLKEWLNTHPDSDGIVDPETGFRAYYQSGGRVTFYANPGEIKEKAPDFHAYLKSIGAIKEVIDEAAWKEARKSSQITKADHDRWTHEGEKSPSLQIKKVER